MEPLTATERKELREKYANVKFPDPVLEPVWWGRRPEFKIEGRKAIVDQNSNTVYGVCSDQYQLIHYEDIIRMVEKTVDALPEFGKIALHPIIIGEGEKIKITALMEEKPFEIRKKGDMKVGDLIHPTVTVKSSYDLGWKLIANFGAMRLACTNGMMVGTTLKRFANRHIVSLDPESMVKSIQKGMALYSDQVGLWKKWAETKLNAATYEAVWEALPFSENEKEKIEKLPESATNLTLEEAKKKFDFTLWDFHNVVTQFATHEIKSEMRRHEIEPQIVRAFEAVRN